MPDRAPGTTKYENVRKVVGPVQNAECGSISPDSARRGAACCALLDSRWKANRQGHPGSSIFR